MPSEKSWTVAGFAVHSFDTLDSTNIKARRYSPGNVIVAKEQSAGRGRFERSWDSGIGGVYMSIVAGTAINKARFLTLLSAIAVQHTLVRLFDVDARIKWPNDLILGEKKLCGILTESKLSGNETKMIIGIGINTNNRIRSELRNIAISLRDKGICADNDKLVNEVIKEFAALYCAAQDNSSSLINEWKRLSHTLGKRVHVVTQQAEIIGYAVDIDEDFSLIIENDDGSRERIVEGDIFVS